mmetsp:Transcript_15672/g.32426  ORF Transcript_15672/g.32426 Transcript_15672/m.32426 type:complete len:216 (-) Transcript_15672:56-703(-)
MFYLRQKHSRSSRLTISILNTPWLLRTLQSLDAITSGAHRLLSRKTWPLFTSVNLFLLKGRLSKSLLWTISTRRFLWLLPMEQFLVGTFSTGLALTSTIKWFTHSLPTKMMATKITTIWITSEWTRMWTSCLMICAINSWLPPQLSSSRMIPGKKEATFHALPHLSCSSPESLLTINHPPPLHTFDISDGLSWDPAVTFWAVTFCAILYSYTICT